MSNKDLTKEVKKWTKKHTELDPKILFTLPDGKFESVGKFCLIENEGGELEEKNRDTLLTLLNTIYDEAVSKKKAKDADVESDTTNDKEKPKRKNIQDHMREKAAEVCGDIEGWIDEYVTDPNKETDLRKRDVKKHFLNTKLKTGHCRFVKLFYEPEIAELKEVLGGADSDLKEGYSHLNKIQVKRILEFYENIIKVTEHLKASGTATKKPRKKKATDINKMVSKLKYLEKDSVTGVESIKPIHIVSAKEVWVYNTKTRKLGFYVAADDSGLSVKGTSIKNFSEKSVTRTIRKTSKFSLKKFAKASKTNKKKEFKDVNSLETKLNGRTNEHTLIVFVEK